MSDDIEILEQLRAREPLFHRTELGTSRAWFEAETAEDFWEVGASGSVYDRAFVWATLAERYAAALPDAAPDGAPDAAPDGVARASVARASGPPDVWAIEDLAVRHLAGDVYLLTYRLHQGERVSRRATVWERAGGRWRALYHQGTLVSAPPATVAP